MRLASLGLPSIGVDSSPVAATLTEGKLANASPSEIVDRARRIIDGPPPKDVPEGEFWSLAFHPDVLSDICRLREGLLEDTSPPGKALKAVALGALHGPLTKGAPSYFSNQCTRTYAPKPRYAVQFWKARGLLPRPGRSARSDPSGERSARAVASSEQEGALVRADSRALATFAPFGRTRPSWVVTSPPFYGMKTYLPDQWLRHWFVGGPPVVDYSPGEQLVHSEPRRLRRPAEGGVGQCCSCGERSGTPRRTVWRDK